MSPCALCEFYKISIQTQETQNKKLNKDKPKMDHLWNDPTKGTPGQQLNCFPHLKTSKMAQSIVGKCINRIISVEVHWHENKWEKQLILYQQIRSRNAHNIYIDKYIFS